MYDTVSDKSLLKKKHVKNMKGQVLDCTNA